MYKNSTDIHQTHFQFENDLLPSRTVDPNCILLSNASSLHQNPMDINNLLNHEHSLNTQHQNSNHPIVLPTVDQILERASQKNSNRKNLFKRNSKKKINKLVIDNSLIIKKIDPEHIINNIASLTKLESQNSNNDTNCNNPSSYNFGSSKESNESLSLAQHSNVLNSKIKINTHKEDSVYTQGFQNVTFESTILESPDANTTIVKRANTEISPTTKQLFKILDEENDNNNTEIDTKEILDKINTNLNDKSSFNEDFLEIDPAILGKSKNENKSILFSSKNDCSLNPIENSNVSKSNGKLPQKNPRGRPKKLSKQKNGKKVIFNNFGLKEIKNKDNSITNIINFKTSSEVISEDIDLCKSLKFPKPPPQFQNKMNTLLERPKFLFLNKKSVISENFKSNRKTGRTGKTSKRNNRIKECKKRKKNSLTKQCDSNENPDSVLVTEEIENLRNIAKEASNLVTEGPQFEVSLQLLLEEQSMQNDIAREELYTNIKPIDYEITSLDRKEPNGHGPFNCGFCDKIFKQRSQWKRHVDCIHLKLAKFLCPTCHKAFKRSDHLKNHIRRIHVK